MQVEPTSQPLPGRVTARRGYLMRAARLVWLWGTETVVVFLMAVMVGTIILQVFFRFVLNDPLSWSEELARYTFVWITFLGAAVAYRHGANIAVETVVVMLPERLQLILAWVVDVLLVAALIILLIYGLGIVEVTSGVESTMLEIPMSWVYGALPASAAIMLLYQVELTLRRVTGKPAASAPHKSMDDTR